MTDQFCFPIVWRSSHVFFFSSFYALRTFPGIKLFLSENFYALRTFLMIKLFIYHFKLFARFHWSTFLVHNLTRCTISRINLFSPIIFTRLECFHEVLFFDHWWGCGHMKLFCDHFIHSVHFQESCFSNHFDTLRTSSRIKLF